MAEENIISIAIEKMDLARPNVIPIVRMMQDDKVGRKITVGLYENGNTWIPPESVSAQVQYSKPDGTGGLYDSIPGYCDTAWKFEENKLTVFIAPQVTSCPGIVELAVRIIVGNFQFSTFTIKIDVQKTPSINMKSDDFVSVGGLLPAVGWGSNKILSTNENGEVVALDAYLDLDLTAYTVDYAAESQVLDVTDAVPAETIEALANGEVGNPVRLIFSSGASTTVNMVLPDRYKTAEGYYRYFGTSGNLSQVSYSTMFLQPTYSESTGWTLYLQCYANQLKNYIKTINGVAPDENGNVEVETTEEKPVAMDLSGYKAGTIVLTYADGGTMDVAVTFDDAENPIKFSNGVEEFTVTWPAEEVAESTEEATS